VQSRENVERKIESRGRGDLEWERGREDERKRRRLWKKEVEVELRSL
jgi:hypothetical protein